MSIPPRDEAVFSGERSHRLTEAERIHYFPNGACTRAFPLLEIELNSAFVDLGYTAPLSSSDVDPSIDSDISHTEASSSKQQDAAAKRNRWKPLGGLLGQKTMRFGLLLTQFSHLTALDEHTLHEELHLPTDAVATRLHYLGNAELSIPQFEDVLLYHASLIFLLYGSGILANFKSTQWTRFRTSVDNDIVVIPLLPTTPPFTPTLSLVKPSTSDIHPPVVLNSSSAPQDTYHRTDAAHSSNQISPRCEPLNDPLMMAMLKSNFAASFIDFDRLDTFLSTRVSEPYDELRHLPSTIIRSCYNDAIYTLVDRIPGEGIDSVLPFNGKSMPLKDFMAERWNIHDLVPTRALLLAVPLTFKIKLAMNTFPSASKYILPAAQQSAETDPYNVRMPLSRLLRLLKYQREDAPSSSSSMADGNEQTSEENLADLDPTVSQDADPSLQDFVHVVEKVGRRLIPQKVVALPVTLHDMNYASYLPSVILALRRRLNALEVHKMITLGYEAELNYYECASMATMEEALTCSSSSDLKNYERLETLGDTALKYAASFYLFLTRITAGEGGLTSEKLRFISNKDLAKTERNRVLVQNCIPDQLCKSVKGRKKRNYAHLSTKTKADLCESVLGHFYLSYGEPGIRIFLHWIDKAHRKLMLDAFKVLTSPTPFFLQPPEQWLLEPHLEVPEQIPIASYRFKHRHLLAMALTHPSAMLKPAGQTYERLEFLGDAVLDLVIVSLLFKEPHLTPGDMSTYRSQIACNASYGFLATLYGLHGLMLHNSPIIYQEIEAYIHTLNDLMNKSSVNAFIELVGDKGLSNLKTPSSLADVFEAIAGAVFLDLGGDVTLFSEVYTPIMLPVVQRYLKIDLQSSGARHPRIEFSELLQAHQCHSELKTTENEELKVVWHGLLLSSVHISDRKIDVERQLYQTAFEHLKRRDYLWDEYCDCNPENQN